MTGFCLKPVGLTPLNVIQFTWQTNFPRRDAIHRSLHRMLDSIINAGLVTDPMDSDLASPKLTESQHGQ
jgi:hypothetical protein